MRRWLKLLGIFAPAAGLLALLAYGFTMNPREIPTPLLARSAPPLSLPLLRRGPVHPG